VVTEPVQALLARALDVASLRQAVHTSNIANAGVDGFQRLDVSFDAELARASVGTELDASDGFASARVVQTHDSVRLDREMALMAKDAVQYQALLGAVNHSFGLLRLAIREGKEA
jgi:flagellar basal-body rod protein FlgB